MSNTTAIFDTQKKFQELLKVKVDSHEFRKQMILGLIEETMEVAKTFPMKAHKKNQEFDKLAFINECVDVQLYLMNLVLSVEEDWSYFEYAVKQKQDINFERQRNGY